VAVLDIWMEGNLKSLVHSLARGRTSLSQVTRDLIMLGLGAKMEGEPQILGPLGLARPLAELSFGGRPERLAVRIEDELVAELESAFGCSGREAARLAIRLGAGLLERGQVRAAGPMGGPRPLAWIDLPRPKESRAREALERLKRNTRA
jgi:hypothetical protein